MKIYFLKSDSILSSIHGRSKIKSQAIISSNGPLVAGSYANKPISEKTLSPSYEKLSPGNPIHFILF
jgi:hypothetical protein